VPRLVGRCLVVAIGEVVSPLAFRAARVEGPRRRNRDTELDRSLVPSDAGLEVSYAARKR